MIGNVTLTTMTFELVEDGENQELWVHYNKVGTVARTRIPIPEGTTIPFVENLPLFVVENIFPGWYPSNE